MATYIHDASNGAEVIITAGATSRASLYIIGGPLGMSMFVRPGAYKIAGVMTRVVRFARNAVTVVVAGETRIVPIDEFVIAIVGYELEIRNAALLAITAACAARAS